jgi:hypothetical protein
MEQKTPANRAGEVTCPFCNSTNNEMFSLFGQTLLGSQYYCRNCHTVFEAVRWDEPGAVDSGQWAVSSEQ